MRRSGKGKSLRKIQWAILAASFALVLACNTPNDHGRKAQAKPMTYQDTVEVSRDTKLGTAHAYIAIPLSGYDEVWLFFHGAGAVDASIIDIPKGFIAQGRRPPAIVAVTFGAKWTLTAETEKRTFSADGVFWDEVLPLIDECLGKEAKRVGIGYSQGGFNLLSLFADRPDYWSALVLINAAIAEISPADDQAAVDAYVAKARAYTLKQRIFSLFGAPLDHNIRIILKAWGEVSESADVWSRVAPIGRIERLPGRTAIDMPILIACDKSDTFGFAEGNRRLAELFGSDPKLRTVFFRGGHGDIPTSAIRDFFSAEAGLAVKPDRR